MPTLPASSFRIDLCSLLSVSTTRETTPDSTHTTVKGSPPSTLCILSTKVMSQDEKEPLQFKLIYRQDNQQQDRGSVLEQVQSELKNANQTISRMKQVIQDLETENDDLRSYNRNLRSLVKILSDDNDSAVDEDSPQSINRKAGRLESMEMVSDLYGKRNIIMSTKNNHVHKKNQNQINKTNNRNSISSNNNNNNLSSHVKDHSNQDIIPEIHHHRHSLNQRNRNTISKIHTNPSLTHQQQQKDSPNRILPPASITKYAKMMETSIHGSDIVDIPLDIPLEFQTESPSEPVSVVTEASCYGNVKK